MLNKIFMVLIAFSTLTIYCPVHAERKMPSDYEMIDQMLKKEQKKVDAFNNAEPIVEEVREVIIDEGAVVSIESNKLDEKNLENAECLSKIMGWTLVSIRNEALGKTGWRKDIGKIEREMMTSLISHYGACRALDIAKASDLMNDDESNKNFHEEVDDLIDNLLSSKKKSCQYKKSTAFKVEKGKKFANKSAKSSALKNHEEAFDVSWKEQVATKQKK